MTTTTRGVQLHMPTATRPLHGAMPGTEPAPDPASGPRGTIATTTTTATPPPAPAHSRDLLAGSARELLAAGSADEAGSRYAHAHLAALRAAAAVLAARAAAQPRSRRGSRLRSAWVRARPRSPPRLAEWPALRGRRRQRAAAEAGVRGVVTDRERRHLSAEVETFLALVARTLGVVHQPLLGTTGIAHAS